MSGALLDGLAPLLADHVRLTLIALAAAVVITLPLAIAVSRRPRLAFPVVTLAGVVQTIPGLALLALMVPLLGSTGGLGLGVSSFGFPPAVIALTLYAILPVLRNAVTGLTGVEPSVLEAARGMGMTERQVLTGVQLPLAAPVIAAGIRTAAVWTVGAATLATPVGQPCLGNYIFAGLQTRNWDMLLTGVAAAAALAVALDVALGAVEHALAARRRRRALVTLAAVTLGVAALLGLPRVVGDHGPRRPAPAAVAEARPGQPAAMTTVRLGAKTFTEQYILVAAMRRRLEAVGVRVEVAESLGSTVAFDALAQGDIDAYVDYSGTLWANHMKRTAGVPRWRVLAEVEGWLAREHGMRSLGSLGFENTYALAVRRETADRLGLVTIADLAAHSGTLAIGGDYEFFGRREWTAVRDAYGLGFARTASFDSTLMYEALRAGEVDVISAFSSDGRIAAYDLVVLDDPRAALPPYDAMILLGARAAADARVVCALAGLEGAIGVEAMRRANLMVDRADGKATPDQAAAALLADVRDDTVRCR